MARRLKSTPFARFLVAMLFIAPMAYLGAAYYNGEDPIQLVKDKLGIESNTTQAAERTQVNTDDTYDLRQEVENMKERIKELELENSELKEKIRRLELSR